MVIANIENERFQGNGEWFLQANREDFCKYQTNREGFSKSKANGEKIFQVQSRSGMNFCDF
jgi:hypothetical protein